MPEDHESPKGILGFRFSAVSEMLAITAVLLPAVGVAVLWLRYLIAGYAGLTSLATLPGLGELALVGLRASWPLLTFIPLLIVAWYSARTRYRTSQLASQEIERLDPRIEEIKGLKDDLVARFEAVDERLEPYRGTTPEETRELLASIPEKDAQEILAEYQELETLSDLVGQKLADINSEKDAVINRIMEQLAEEFPRWMGGTNLEWTSDEKPKEQLSSLLWTLSIVTALGYIALVLFSEFPGGTVLSLGLAVGSLLGIRLTLGLGDRDREPSVASFWPLIVLIATVGVVSGGLANPGSDDVVEVAWSDSRDDVDEFVLLGTSSGLTYLGTCDGTSHVVVVPTNGIESLTFTDNSLADFSLSRLTWSNILQQSLFNVLFNVVPVDDFFVTYSETCRG